MIESLLKSFSPEQRESLLSANIYEISLGVIRTFEPEVYSMFEARSNYRKVNIDQGLRLRISRKEKIKFLKKLISPVKDLLQISQVQGVIIPAIYSSFGDLYKKADSEMNLLKILKDDDGKISFIPSLMSKLEAISENEESFSDKKSILFLKDFKNFWKSLIPSHLAAGLPDHTLREKDEFESFILKNIYVLLAYLYLENEYFNFLKGKIKSLRQDQIELTPNIEIDAHSKIETPIFSEKIFDKLIDILLPHFTEENDSSNLLAIFKGEKVEKKLFFNGSGVRLTEVFRKLLDERLIYSEKQLVTAWICKNFSFYSGKTKQRSSFKKDTVYKILTLSNPPGNKKKEIDLSSILNK